MGERRQPRRLPGTVKGGLPLQGVDSFYLFTQGDARGLSWYAPLGRLI